MERQKLSKLIAGLLLAVAIAYFMHSTNTMYSEMGKDAFLAKEALRYELYYGHPKPLLGNLVESIAMVGLILGTYELLALFTFKVLDKAAPKR